MKKLLLALALISTNAIASDWYVPNTDGGKIVVTDSTCEFKGKTYSALRRAYTVVDTGEFIEGCWYLDGNYVSIIYRGGEERKYDALNFTEIKRNKKEVKADM